MSLAIRRLRVRTPSASLKKTQHFQGWNAPLLLYHISGHSVGDAAALLDDGPVLILCLSILMVQWQVELADELGIRNGARLTNNQ